MTRREPRITLIMVLALVLTAAVSTGQAGAAFVGTAQAQAAEMPPTRASEAATRVTGECTKAKKKLKQAKKKLKQAKESGDETRIKKAKKQVKKAKKKKRRACSTSSANRPPTFQDPFTADSTRVEYNYSSGFLISAIAHIVLNPAIDPDGDKLTYSWAASQGSGASNPTNICAGVDVFGRDCEKSGPEPAATWVVYADPFQCIPEGRADVTVSDGKGGEDKGQITFLSNC